MTVRQTVRNSLIMQVSGYAQAESDRLDAVFSALADPTRRAILARLSTGDATVAQLTAPFDMTQPAISRHLKVLEKAGLISRGKDAQRRPSRLEAQPLAEANGYLERYREHWERSFNELDDVLEELKGNEAKKPRRKK